MLNIYPEKRARAVNMIVHPWIYYSSRNKDHLVTDPQQAEHNLVSYQQSMIKRCAFYRELKDFDDQFYDADCGEAPHERDEYEDEDVGFRRSLPHSRETAT